MFESEPQDQQQAEVLDTEEISNYCLKWIKRIRNDEENTLDKDRSEALKYYKGEKLGNELKGRSQLVTTDLQDTIEWILPSLLRVFASGDEVCTLQPRGMEDIEPCEMLNELVNYQCRIRNRWFTMLHDWFKDALLMKVGVVKYQWVVETKTVKKTYQGLNEMEVQALSQEGEGLQILSLNPSQESDPMMPLYDVMVEVTKVDEHPVIEAVPPEEIGFPMRTKDIQDVTFLYHMVRLEPWDVIKRYGEGMLDEIKDRTRSLNPLDTNLVDQERFSDLGGTAFLSDPPTDSYWIYECYYPEPTTGTPMITVMCGDLVLEHRENEYGKAPFVAVTPVKMSHRVIGRSMHDLIKDLQKLRTVLIRQILDNVYFSNLGRYIADPDQVNLNDFLNNNHPGAVIRGNPDAVKELLPPQLQPWTFKLMEFVQGEKENRSGITRYNQGLDANSLNKTARGMTAILQQSQQRLEMMARLFAEMGVGPLIEALVDCNIKFLTKKTAVRVANVWQEINPDNLIGSYDVIVEVGIGTGAKDMIIAQMQQLLGLYTQLIGSGLPVVTPQNVYNAMRELVKAMGYRNINDFVTDPQQQQAMQMLLQAVQQHIAVEGPQDPMLMQALMMTMQAFGMMPPGMGPGMPGMPGMGEGSATQPNLPQNLAQPMQPTMTPDGGGYFG